MSRLRSSLTPLLMNDVEDDVNQVVSALALFLFLFFRELTIDFVFPIDE